VAQAMLGFATRLRIAPILSNAQHGDVLGLHNGWRRDLRSCQNRGKEKEDATPIIMVFHKRKLVKQLMREWYAHRVFPPK
jgi:hypothetical protein